MKKTNNKGEIHYTQLNMCMGKTNDWENIPCIQNSFISKKEILEILNSIGYSGCAEYENKKYSSFEDFLNDYFKNTVFKVIQTNHSNGDFHDSYLAIWYDLNQSKIPNYFDLDLTKYKEHMIQIVIEYLSLCDFSLYLDYADNQIFFKLKDITDANFGDIEDDSFDNLDQVICRLEMYHNDTIYGDIYDRITSRQYNFLLDHYICLMRSFIELPSISNILKEIKGKYIVELIQKDIMKKEEDNSLCFKENKFGIDKDLSNFLIVEYIKKETIAFFKKIHNISDIHCIKKQLEEFIELIFNDQFEIILRQEIFSEKQKSNDFLFVFRNTYTNEIWEVVIKQEYLNLNEYNENTLSFYIDTFIKKQFELINKKEEE